MVSGVNQKIIGAIVVGGALVAGAYTLATFGIGKAMPANVSGAAVAPERVTIPVEDKDQNGVEDWRDSFFLEGATIISTVEQSNYIGPQTQTAKVAVSLIEDSIYAKNTGAFGKSKEQVVADAVAQIAENGQAKIYDPSDIIIMETWTDSDLRMYANAMGQIMTNAKAPSKENEIEILKAVMLGQQKERLSEIAAIARGYEMYRDESLKLPVPKPLVKQHLDLINTYEALHQDIDAFTYVVVDPLQSLVYLQRYPDDSLGLRLALSNIAKSLGSLGVQFEEQDSGLIFGFFLDNYQTAQ